MQSLSAKKETKSGRRTVYYNDGNKRSTLSVRMERDDYYDLQSAADDAGLSLSTYARIVLMRASKKPLNQSKEKQTVYNPDAEFAEYLATAMALMIVSGAHATDGLDAKVKEMTLDIMKSLGADIS